MLPGVLFNWALILYGTETDPLKGNFHINSSLPTRSPTSTTSTWATEATEIMPTALSGQCLQTRYDKEVTNIITGAKGNKKMFKLKITVFQNISLVLERFSYDLEKRFR